MQTDSTRLVPESEESLNQISVHPSNETARVNSGDQTTKKEVLDETDEAKYQKKKMLSSGMMDLALLSANANQLRHTLQAPDHQFYFMSLILIITSLIIQVTVGILLIVNTNYTSPKRGESRGSYANVLNNSITAGVLLISAINVFISAFGVSVA